MIGQLLRREFDSGRAGLYIFVATPISLLVAFALPPSFLPFISAALFFPVYFYYTRSENHYMSLALLGVWTLMIFSELSFVVSLGPDAVGEAFGLSTPSREPSPLIWRMVDVAYSVALAAISGGAFFLVKAAMRINEMAFYFGIFTQAGNVGGAILSITPWMAMTGIGHAVAAQGASSLFYAKLEGASVAWGKIGWLIGLGVALAFAGAAGEIYLNKP